MWRTALRSHKAQFLFALAALYVAWEVWLSLAAPGKIAGNYPPDAERVSILVTLSFPPERFHVQAFQAYGRVSGTEGNSIEVRGVKKSDLAALARLYWVRRVEPLPTGG
jgi:hypothetical protein